MKRNELKERKDGPVSPGPRSHSPNADALRKRNQHSSWNTYLIERLRFLRLEILRILALQVIRVPSRARCVTDNQIVFFSPVLTKWVSDDGRFHTTHSSEFPEAWIP